MSHFLHTSVRLYSDVRKAYKRFTVTDELNKWFSTEIQGSVNEGNTVNGLLAQQNVLFQITYKALEREASMVFDFSAPLADAEARPEPYQVEIRFMQCTSDTYYCTEIHLMQYGFEDTEQSLKAREIYRTFWEEKLETLRQMINRDWVIQDSELTLKCLM